MFDSVGDFALAVYRYGKATGASVTSWGRTAARNKKVGGVRGSFHLTWKAVDVVYESKPSLKAAKEAAREQGLLLIREKNHDHLQPL